MTNRTPCIECNKLTSGYCEQHKNAQILQGGVCPCEDGTCPTLLKDLHKGDEGFCGYHAHIVRAKYVKPPLEATKHSIDVNNVTASIPVDPADANICDGCE